MMKRTTLLLTVFTAAMVMALMIVAMALPAFAGGEGDDEENDNESANGGSTRNDQIVFRRWFDPDQTKGAIFTMNPDGSHTRQITHPPKGWLDNLPAWSPDGKRITFERFKTDESTSRVMVVNPDTGNTRAVVPCTGERCVYAIDPYFSPDGHSIAYSHTVGPFVPKGQPRKTPVWKLYSAIFIVGLDGSDPHQVTSTPKRHKGQLATDTSDPVFSPNGKMLTFVRTNYKKENDRFAVFVQPLGSPEDAHRITPWELNCQDRPVFSPDGKLVLFRCLPKGEEGPSNLYWVHPDGTGLHALTHAPAANQYLGSSFSPSFHKGEGWITVGRTAGYGKEGNADVFRILIEDGKVVRSVNLTKSEKWESAPGWGTHPPVG
jgi:Tol biopolymer transport system component